MKSQQQRHQIQSQQMASPHIPIPRQPPTVSKTPRNTISSPSTVVPRPKPSTSVVPPPSSSQSRKGTKNTTLPSQTTSTVPPPQQQKQQSKSRKVTPKSDGKKKVVDKATKKKASSTTTSTSSGKRNANRMVVPGSGIRKPYHHKSGVVAARQVKKLQKTTNTLIPLAPFKRLVREVADATPQYNIPKKGGIPTPIRFKVDAIRALLEAGENEVMRNLVSAYRITAKGKRNTVTVDDWRTANDVFGIRKGSCEVITEFIPPKVKKVRKVLKKSSSTSDSSINNEETVNQDEGMDEEEEESNAMDEEEGDDNEEEEEEEEEFQDYAPQMPVLVSRKNVRTSKQPAILPPTPHPPTPSQTVDSQHDSQGKIHGKHSFLNNVVPAQRTRNPITGSSTGENADQHHSGKQPDRRQELVKMFPNLAADK